MRARLRRRWILAALILAAPAPARAADELEDALAVAGKTEKVFESLAERVDPAEVNVRPYVKDAAWWAAASSKGKTPAGWRVVSDEDRMYPGMRPVRGASGFLVSQDGYLLTLRRVVVDRRTQREADVIDVEVGETHYKAQVVSLEPTLDFAILKIAPTTAVPFLKMGDSGLMRVGHWAVAFGDPDGREKTLAPGVLAYQSARDCYQDEMSATYLQTSAPVCDGALGGPVVNLRGEVIGISTRRGDSAMPDSLATAAGSGYTLPINLATAIYQSLLARRSKDSPWLGISVLLLNDELRAKLGDANLSGIYIDNVFDPSPAATVGIRVGDVLQSMDGQPVKDVYDFQAKLYRLGTGSKVRLGIVRDRKPLEFNAAITTRPATATTR